MRAKTSGIVGQASTISSHDKDFKSNVFSWPDEVGRPTFESITKTDVHDLDKRNRFFTDNKKLYSSYRHKAPQLYVYRDLVEDEPRPAAHMTQEAVDAVAPRQSTA